jgi:hypothetical protein
VRTSLRSISASSKRSLTSSLEVKVLQAMAGGWTLKAHRYLDGRKEYRLHSLDGTSEAVAQQTVEGLSEAGLIDSNKKFPAATFWLTEKGRSIV